MSAGAAFYCACWSCARAAFQRGCWSKRCARHQTRRWARVKSVFTARRVGRLLEMLLPSYWICSLACPPFFILSSPVPSDNASASLPLDSQMTVDLGTFPIPYCCVRASS